MSGDRSAPSVLFVLPDFNGGGAERAVLRIIKAWPDGLPAPSVAVKATDGPLGGEFRELGVPVVDLGGRTRHSRLSSVRSAWALRRLVVATRPTTVVAVLSAPFVVASCRTVRRRPRVAVSVQNPVVTEGSLKRYGPARRLLTTAALRTADVVVSISPGIAEELRGLGVRATRLVVVPNPVEVEAFRRGTQGRSAREKQVVVLARLEPQKRLDIALRAFAVAGLDGWRLCIHGTGSQQGALERLAESLGIADRVTFAGFTDDPAAVLGQARLFFLTSEYEGFGNVLVEALAAGLPIVSTDAPFGPRFVLDDGRYGELCPVNDVACLAAALRRAAQADHGEVAVAVRVARAAQFAAAVVAPAFAAAVLP